MRPPQNFRHRCRPKGRVRLFRRPESVLIARRIRQLRVRASRFQPNTPPAFPGSLGVARSPQKPKPKAADAAPGKEEKGPLQSQGLRAKLAKAGAPRRSITKLHGNR